MSRQTKRTSAPSPVEIPPSGPVEIPPPGAHSVPPPAIPSMFPGAWFPTCPPQSSASSTASRWIAGVQQASMVGTSAQVPWWTPPPGIGASASPWSMVEKTNGTDLEAWMRLYNWVSQRCFSDCVTSFYRKALGKREEDCVRACVRKFLLLSSASSARFADPGASAAFDD